jgi:hypothetical protein
VDFIDNKRNVIQPTIHRHILQLDCVVMVKPRFDKQHCGYVNYLDLRLVCLGRVMIGLRELT